MTTDHERADLTLAYEIYARRVIQQALTLDIEDMWEFDTFSDIGEHDWEVIVDRARQIADTLDATFTPQDRADALATLTARTDKEA